MTSSDAHAMRLTVLGARGSVSVSGPEYHTFGGATSCYLVEVAGEHIILDAGSGMLRAPVAHEVSTSILVSHMHVDHIVGLGMYKRLSQPGVTTSLFLPAKTDDEALLSLERLYSPPLWPLKLTEYGGDLKVRALPDTLRIGDVAVTTIDGNHPGGCKAIRLSYANRSIVYATDYEYEDSSFNRLVDFVREADLILYDAQYTDEELDAHRGFGHASPSSGLELLARSGAKRLLLVHHDPRSDDETLAVRQQALAGTSASYAREGEAIQI